MLPTILALTLAPNPVYAGAPIGGNPPHEINTMVDRGHEEPTPLAGPSLELARLVYDGHCPTIAPDFDAHYAHFDRFGADTSPNAPQSNEGTVACTLEVGKQVVVITVKNDMFTDGYNLRTRQGPDGLTLRVFDGSLRKVRRKGSLPDLRLEDSRIDGRVNVGWLEDQFFHYDQIDGYLFLRTGTGQFGIQVTQDGVEAEPMRIVTSYVSRRATPEEQKELEAVVLPAWEELVRETLAAAQQ